MLAKITIIGRPNVGKSSLFNMMTGHKIAIVADEAGTTRDISEFEYTDEKNDLTYILADSGGLDYSSATDEIAVDITERTERSIVESDLLIWTIEYDRFTELDESILRIIQKHKVVNYIVLANKADNESQVMESYSMAGRGELEFFPVSSSHNAGIGDVRRYIAKYLKDKGLNYKKEQEDPSLKMAFIGRPNVGKSSILNTIV
jgi:GTP-binding protein